MQHIHIVNWCRSSKLAPNIRGVLQHRTLAVPNEKSSSTQAPNIRGVLQCSTFTLSIKDVVQHKRQIHEVFCNAAHPVAILRGCWVGYGPPRFLLGPRFVPPVFFLISRLSSFGWHIQGCQMRFVKILAISSTAPHLSCVVIRKQHRENRHNPYC